MVVCKFRYLVSNCFIQYRFVKQTNHRRNENAENCWKATEHISTKQTIIKTGIVYVYVLYIVLSKMFLFDPLKQAQIKSNSKAIKQEN